MIRIAVQPKHSVPTWHKTFLRMLPQITAHARVCFRRLGPAACEDASKEVVCSACVVIARLAELGKLDLAYPTVLAKFGVAGPRGQARPAADRLAAISCPRPASACSASPSNPAIVAVPRRTLRKLLAMADRTAGPADSTATRVASNAWLRSLPRCDRHGAETPRPAGTAPATWRRGSS